MVNRAMMSLAVEREENSQLKGNRIDIQVYTKLREVSLVRVHQHKCIVLPLHIAIYNKSSMQVPVLLVIVIKLVRILQPDPEVTDYAPENLLAVALPADAHQMVSWTPSQGLRMHQQTSV